MSKYCDLDADDDIDDDDDDDDYNNNDNNIDDTQCFSVWENFHTILFLLKGCVPHRHHQHLILRCEQRGEVYFWCNRKIDGGWGYCSPDTVYKEGRMMIMMVLTNTMIMMVMIMMAFRFKDDDYYDDALWGWE